MQCPQEIGKGSTTQHPIFPLFTSLCLSMHACNDLSLGPVYRKGVQWRLCSMLVLAIWKAPLFRQAAVSGCVLSHSFSKTSMREPWEIIDLGPQRSNACFLTSTQVPPPKNWTPHAFAKRLAIPLSCSVQHGGCSSLGQRDPCIHHTLAQQRQELWLIFLMYHNEQETYLMKYFQRSIFNYHLQST